MDMPNSTEDLISRLEEISGPVETEVNNGRIVEPDKDNVMSLTDQLQKEKEDRKQERFILVLVIVILFDSFWFAYLDWGGVIAILILEIIALMVVAEKLGISSVLLLINKIANFNKKND